MAQKKKKTAKRSEFPVVGAYIDTPTKAKVDVVYFIDDIGESRLIMENFPSVYLKNCRMQFKVSDVKRKKKFYEALQIFLNFSEAWKYQGAFPIKPQKMPLLFGFLKLRRRKIRKFILIQSVDKYIASKVINVVGVIIDNLLYLDLVNKIKTKA